MTKIIAESAERALYMLLNEGTYFKKDDGQLGTYSVISIREKSSENTALTITPTKRCKDVLSVTFMDIDPAKLSETSEYYSHRFTDGLANDIVKFINEQDVDYLLIHCEAGISRSQAVASIADIILNSNYDISDRVSTYNWAIFNMLQSASHDHFGTYILEKPIVKKVSDTSDLFDFEEHKDVAIGPNIKDSFPALNNVHLLNNTISHTYELSRKSGNRGIKYGNEMISTNDRMHHAVRSQITKFLRDKAKEETPLPIIPYSKRNPCKVVITVFAPTRRRMDSPNWYPTVKALIDGMTDAGVWDDDDNSVIKEISFKYGGLSGNKNYKLKIDVKKS